MRLKNNLLHLMAAAALAGGTAMAQAPAQQAPSATPAPAATAAPAGTATPHASSDAKGVDTTSLVGEDDKKFIVEAAQGGMAEVQLAQLAQQKASSDTVKQYAKMLEDDHTKANTALKQVAERKSVALPADVGPKNQALLTKLQALSGDQFDRAYTKAMVKDHKKDVKEFQRQIDRGMDSDVKAFASETLPRLQKHLQDVQQIASSKGSSSDGSTRSRSADKAPDSSTAAPASAPAPKQ